MYWLILVVICLIFIVTLFYNQNRYSKIPGPTIAELFRMAHKCRRFERLLIFEKLFHTYGPILKTRLGLKCFVHVGTAEYAQKVLSSSVNVEKSYLYGFSKIWLGDSLPISKSETWHTRRKLLTPAFNSNIINEYISVMVKNFQTFTVALEKEVDSEKFNILPYIAVGTMNTIGETAMNMNLHAEKGVTEIFGDRIHQLGELMTKRFLNPLFHFDFIHAFSKNHKMMVNISEDLHKISHQVMSENLSKRQEQRLSSQKETPASDDELDQDRRRRRTYLDILLDKYEEGDKTLTLKDIREEVDTAIFAGYDTVSVAVGYTIFLVGHHPEIQDKIHAELDSLLPTEDTPVNAKTLAEMNYLECVIKESLRLYSPASWIARCLKEPVTFDKYTVPAGTDVFIHFHAIHRSPAYYSNPDKFDPSNFFPDNAKKLHPFAFLPFSAGPRNCIGQKYGKLETKVALALFFKKYKVESMIKMEDMKLLTDLVLQPMNGIIVNIKKRC